MENKTYRNTFEIFGDPSPAKAKSAEDYAMEILPLFTQTPILRNVPTTYRVERPMQVGMSNEVEWTHKVWEAAREEAEARGETVDDDAYELPISEESLLEFITEAVEEVTNESEARHTVFATNGGFDVILLIDGSDTVLSAWPATTEAVKKYLTKSFSVDEWKAGCFPDAVSSDCTEISDWGEEAGRDGKLSAERLKFHRRSF